MVTWIVLFFVMAPLIIFYTAGYRYNWENHVVDQTGVLSIDTQPRDAQVSLNGIVIDKRLPIRLANRAPGTYRVTIERPGYKRWEKEVTVDSKQTTYIRNITLFRETLPTPIIQDGKEPISAMIPSIGGSHFLYTIERTGTFDLMLWNGLAQKSALLNRTKSIRPPLVTWSPYSEAALVGITAPTTTDWYLATAPHFDFEPLLQTTAPAETLVYEWYRRPPYTQLYVAESSAIFLVTRNGREQVVALPGATVWHADAAQQVWYYDESLKTISVVGNQTLSVPFRQDEKVEKIIDVNDERLIVKTPNKIEIISRQTGEEETIHLGPGNGLIYNRATDEWVVWSPTELWSIYPNGNVTLLSRTSDPILSVTPLDQFGVLLIHTEKNLTAFNPGYYVSHTLFSNGSIQTVAVDSVTRTISFLGTVGSRHGIFSLSY